MRIKTSYFTFEGFHSNKRYWFPKGIFWGIILFLNDPFHSRPKWIVSTYSYTGYESITTLSGLFRWVWVLYYLSQGHSFKKKTVTIEPYSKDKVSYWQPYMNIN